MQGQSAHRHKSRRLGPRRSHHGVTLLEFLVAIAMVGILVTIGVPSYQAVANRLQAQGGADQFRAAIQKARQEALNRSREVTVCQRDGTDACVNNGGNWEHGWLLFVDDNSDGDRQNGETILAVEQGLSDGYTLRMDGGYETVQLKADGGADNSYTFRLCGPDNQTSEAKRLRVNIAGRVRLDGEPTQCP